MCYYTSFMWGRSSSKDNAAERARRGRQGPVTVQLIVDSLNGFACPVGGRSICEPETAHRFGRRHGERPITSTSCCYFAILSDMTWTSFLSA